MKDEALRLALEALGHFEKAGLATLKTIDAITAIKQVLEQPEHSCIACEGNPKGKNNPCNVCGLAQPEPEPVVWMYQDKSTHEVQFQKNMRSFVDHSRTSEVPLYGEPLSNHELQCVCGAVWCGDEMVHLPNKTSPCQPLTDDEFISMVDSAGLVVDPIVAFEIKEMVEAAHGIKGEA